MRIAACLWLLAACGDGRQPPTPPPPAVERAAREPEPARARADEASPPIDAAAPDFNARVLALIDDYAPGGGYAWPAPRGTHGTTRDLIVDGERFARSSDGPTHCSGLTFEILWRALEQTGAARELDPAAARELMRRWFVPTDGGLGPADALPHAGLGVRIPELERARPGDFVQVWMNDGRGHTMIFLGWERDADGSITGMRHFSTHPDTDGIGVMTRAIGDRPDDIDRDAIYIARARPRGRLSEPRR